MILFRAVVVGIYMTGKFLSLMGQNQERPTTKHVWSNSTDCWEQKGRKKQTNKQRRGKESERKMKLSATHQEVCKGSRCMNISWCHAIKTYPSPKHAQRHEEVWGSGGITPRILNLGTRWSWVVRFTSRPLYHRGKSPPVPAGLETKHVPHANVHSVDQLHMKLGVYSLIWGLYLKYMQTGRISDLYLW